MAGAVGYLLPEAQFSNGFSAASIEVLDMGASSMNV